MPIRYITAATIIQILNCYIGFFLKEILQDTKLQRNIGLGKSLSAKTVALRGQIWDLCGVELTLV